MHTYTHHAPSFFLVPYHLWCLMLHSTGAHYKDALSLRNDAIGKIMQENVTSEKLKHVLSILAGWGIQTTGFQWRLDSEPTGSCGSSVCKFQWDIESTDPYRSPMPWPHGYGANAWIYFFLFFLLFFLSQTTWNCQARLSGFTLVSRLRLKPLLHQTPPLLNSYIVDPQKAKECESLLYRLWSDLRPWNSRFAR